MHSRRDASVHRCVEAAVVDRFRDSLAASPEVPWFENGEQAALATYVAGVEAFVCRYVALPSEHEGVAIALWVAHAHLVEQFETSPLLAVTSADMRSGKTRLLDVLQLLVPRPYKAVEPSDAAVYTILAQRPRPTLLLDEADVVFGSRYPARHEGLRAILNAGNRQGTPVLRVKLLDRGRREVEQFDVYGPKAIAGIGNLPDTVADRAIAIRLKRRRPDEAVQKFRHRTALAEARDIADPPIVTLVPDVPVPDELNDRAADSWEPLLAVAYAAGGYWPERARLAAIALSRQDALPMTAGMRLLADIREAFGNEDHLSTAELLRRLHEIDDAEWADWYGSPLTARGLATLLRPYGVGPSQRRVRGEKSRGYFRSDFGDAWARYLTPQESESSGTNGPDVLADPVSAGFWSAAGTPAIQATPLAAPRLCPACHRMHTVGTTCRTVRPLGQA